VAETSKPNQPSYPSVVKLQLEVTLEQASVLYRGLKALRGFEEFNSKATQATDEERKQARHDLFVIDRLKGMFE
jgi:hypothetical protein